jgi:tetratricopeptide (TPR) repeat protein
MQSYLWGMVLVSAHCKRFRHPLSGILMVGLLLSFLSNCNGKPRKDSTLQKDSSIDSIQPRAVLSAYDQALLWAEQGDLRVIKLCDSLLTAPDKQAGASPYYYLGIYYAEIKDTANALASFDKTIVADYTFLEAYIEKAALLLAQKKSEAARKELELLRAVAPSYAPCHYWIAKVAVFEQKNDLALVHYKLALSLDSTLQEAREAIFELEK